MMHYMSVCSGIEAATVAWHPLGWKPAAFAEIEPFPSAVLAHHYPEIPNYGDITKYQEWPDQPDVDVLVGGTPCQSFSVAGLRKGLADPRGNLALTFLGIADRYRPEWIVWENVPGVLSQDGGRAFGSILGGMAELGYHGAYRVLDAQHVRVDGLSLRDEGVCLLSEIVETGAVPRQFFLSPKACRGILRRAAARGKALPAALMSALETVAKAMMWLLIGAATLAAMMAHAPH